MITFLPKVNTSFIILYLFKIDYMLTTKSRKQGSSVVLTLPSNNVKKSKAD